jgi:hypothetical protein
MLKAEWKLIVAYFDLNDPNPKRMPLSVSALFAAAIIAAVVLPIKIN